MRRRTAIALTAILTAALTGPASAQQTVNSGEMNQLSSGFDYGPLILELNGTGATLSSGVVIDGMRGYVPIEALAGSTVIMQAGSALNGMLNDPSLYPRPLFPGAGLIVSGGSFIGQGGTVQGGSSLPFTQTEPLGSMGAYFNGSAQISGTSFYGGASPADAQGGAGAEFSAGTYTIEGGTFRGGSGGIGGTGADVGFNFSSWQNADTIGISGGLFQGGDGPTGAINGTALALHMGLGNTATISGGTFLGSTSDPGPAGNGYALSVDGFSYAGPFKMSRVNITGGRFVGDIALDVTSTDVSFFGTGFTYNYETGEFKGTLLDGTAIDSTIVDEGPVGLLFNYDRADGVVKFIAVPEPSSIVMLALGALGVAAAVRRRARRLA